MNIRKWVDFVLNPVSQERETKEESKVSYCHRFSPEIFSDKILTYPVAKIENALMEHLKERAPTINSVSVDMFESGVDFLVSHTREPEVIADLGVMVESWLYGSGYLSKRFLSAPYLLSEVDYSRMRQFGIYKFGCLIEYESTAGEKRRGLDDIVSDIRAIPTVTIVSVVLANEKISTGRYVAGLQVKFIPSFPGNMSQPEEAKAYILRMIKKIKNVRGISRVSLKTDRVE